MAKNSVKEIPLLSISSASLSGTYLAINASGLPNACYLIRIINGGTTPITISYDGVNDHDVVFANSIAQIVTPVAAVPNSPGGLFPIGTVIYASGTAGTGSIAVSGYYQTIS